MFQENVWRGNVTPPSQSLKNFLIHSQDGEKSARGKILISVVNSNIDFTSVCGMLPRISVLSLADFL